jgi:prepilin-type N-terminal cleavage/methylation domain-containing protein
MRGRRAGWGSDRGESLVEVLVAVAILGIAGVAILAGLQFSVKASVIHRNEATGGAYVRSFAEAIQNYVDSNGYKSCANAPANYSAVAVPGLPAGYTPSVVSLKSWTGSGWGPCTATGVQRLDLKVTSPGDASHRADELLTVIVRQPCNGSAAAAGDDPCS